MTRPMPAPPEHCCCRDGDQPCGLWLDDGPDLYPWYPRDICPGCALHNGDRGSRETRLTEAECSAEYWRAEAEILYFDPEVDHLAWSQAVSRQEIINRIATRPHALEEA